MTPRQKLYLRIKTTTENTNGAVSVYDEKLYCCKNAQTTLICCVVKLAHLVAIYGHLSEVNPDNFVSLLTREVIS